MTLLRAKFSAAGASVSLTSLTKLVVIAATSLFHLAQL